MDTVQIKTLLASPFKSKMLRSLFGTTVSVEEQRSVLNPTYRRQVMCMQLEDHSGKN